MIFVPKISIIIPVYKVEKYICECIDSILSQDYKDFEIILVDDGSPDRCPEICDNYAKQDNRIKVIHKQNGGPSSARNAGLLACEGEYIWFVDGDDFIEKDSLAILSAYFIHSPSIIRFETDKRNKEKKTDVKITFTGIADQSVICTLAKNACTNSLFPYCWRNVYKKSFLTSNNLKFYDNLNYGEDSVFNSQAYFLADSIIFTDDYLYVYRFRTSGLSKIVDEKFNFKGYENIIMYDRLRDENYKKFCQYPSDEYYKDAGRFTLEKMYQYILIPRVYQCKDKNKYKLFRMISKSEIVKKAFSRFDINEVKSKSLDWWLLWAVKHKLYLLGHIMCRFVLYKDYKAASDPVTFE